MDITIFPRKLCGVVKAIPSKSQAHRILICAAFSDKKTEILCPETNRDIEATALCLRQLGATIQRTDSGYIVIPITASPETAVLNCDESGSTLRFMLPIVGALGTDTIISMSGRLPHRPLSPLWEEMERMGCQLSRPTHNTIRCHGKLRFGEYQIDGGTSSQFITGLLLALSLIPGNSKLNITGKVESRHYITMTQSVLCTFGVKSENGQLSGIFPFHSPGKVEIEGDWSNAAFFLTAKFLGNPVTITGLDSHSCQGDRAIVDILEKLPVGDCIDAGDIPDLVPILSVAAGTSSGCQFVNVARLRLKESDRIETVTNMMNSLGVHAFSGENELHISSSPFYKSCTIDACNDHRIAMAAAIAATTANGPITILGAECVSKSYPSFWQEYRKLGGYYEQYIR